MYLSRCVVSGCATRDPNIDQHARRDTMPRLHLQSSSSITTSSPCDSRADFTRLIICCCFLSRVAHTCRILACMRSQHSVHREYGSIVQKIESPTGPRPVDGFLNKLAGDRIGVHVVEFFLPLPGTPGIHVIAPALPYPEVRVMVNGGRQLNATEHLLTPGIARIIFQILQNK